MISTVWRGACVRSGAMSSLFVSCLRALPSIRMFCGGVVGPSRTTTNFFVSGSRIVVTRSNTSLFSLS